MKKLIAGFLFLFVCASAQAQYYNLYGDSQRPDEQFVIPAVFAGNTPYLRYYYTDNDVAGDLTPWTMTFRYSYGQYDTNGMVTIAGTVAGNCATFLGTTNLFFRAFDKYYFSISGSDSNAHIKTFATGRMIQKFDPATAIFPPTAMTAPSFYWWPNNMVVGWWNTTNMYGQYWPGEGVGQSDTNRYELQGVAAGLISTATGEVWQATTALVAGVTGSLTNYDAAGSAAAVSNAAFAQGWLIGELDTNANARLDAQTALQASTNSQLQTQITANQTNQANTNADFDARIAANSGEPIWGAVSNTVITNANNGQTAFLWGNHASAGYLTANTNRFTDLYVANLGALGTNVAGLTQGAYTGVLSSVSYTGVTVLAVGRTYLMGFTKQNNFGTSTLSIATAVLTATAAGTASNYFAFTDATSSNLVLRLDGNGSSKSDASAVYVRQVTSGNLSVAGDVRAGGLIYGTLIAPTSTNGLPSGALWNSNGVANFMP